MYDAAAAAWGKVKSADNIVRRVAAHELPDVEILGYYDPHDGDGGCPFAAVACVNTVLDKDHPYVPKPLRLWIQDRPRTTEIEPAKRWSANVRDWAKERDKFEYLPGVLAHELGHVLGFGHANDVYSVMHDKFLLKEDLKNSCSETNPHCISTNDKIALWALYANLKP